MVHGWMITDERARDGRDRPGGRDRTATRGKAGASLLGIPKWGAMR